MIKSDVHTHTKKTVFQRNSYTNTHTPSARVSNHRQEAERSLVVTHHIILRLQNSSILTKV